MCIKVTATMKMQAMAVYIEAVTMCIHPAAIDYLGSSHNIPVRRQRDFKTVHHHGVVRVAGPVYESL